MIEGIALTNPTRILYPERGITKEAMARFYSEIADWVLPHVVKRPLAIIRCPGGRDGQCFFQKHLKGSLLEGVREVKLKEGSGGTACIVVDSIAGLISLVQISVLEVHPWGARIERIETPDRLIFDLDPDSGLPWARVIEAAVLVRDFLSELGLVSFLKTTGGKGLHVVAPLSGKQGWDEIKAFARGVARSIVEGAPRLYIDTASKSARKGKIFIDYLRNGRGATCVAAYSTRAREGAPVSTPLGWQELKGGQVTYTIENLPRRLKKLRKDPWAGFFDLRQSIRKDALQRVGAGRRGEK